MMQRIVVDTNVFTAAVLRPAGENRKVGTDLTHVKDKLSPEFVNSWVWAPKSFRPSTKMPHLFAQDNNSRLQYSRN